MTKTGRVKFRMSSKIIDHFIEAILIFTSVFLAFWLTEYRESQKEEEMLDISLQHIASEIAYNHRRIESTFDYHSSLIKAIDGLKNETGTDWENLYGDDLEIWKGMQTPLLRSTAYQAFLNTGVSDKADFELAKLLADIYNFQSIIERLDNSFFEIATTDRAFTALPKVRHLAGLYYDLLPSLVLFYQQGGKTVLKEYGYSLAIENDELKDIVDDQMSN